MVSNESSTFYDILDIKPDASADEIRQAYLRAKTAYSKDSVALYTLISPDETKAMLQRIEEAYNVLSNPTKRKEYDSYYGFLDPANEFIEHPLKHGGLREKKIISIDRVPPMESMPDREGDELLVAPATDFRPPTDTPFDRRSTPERRERLPEPAVTAQTPPAYDPQPSASTARPHPQHGSLAYGQLDPELEHEIAIQTEWRGSFLRKVREALKLSIEEVAASTKISKTYLLALEDENFVKLPAAVFVRGFVTQVAKLLKLPSDKVAIAYMERFKQARPT